MSETQEQSSALALADKSMDDVVALLRVSEKAIEHLDEDEAGAPAEPGVQSVPWIGYRTNKSKAKLEELIAAGVSEGSFYLYDRGVIAPKPFYIHLIAAFSYYSQVDKSNQTTGVSGNPTPEQKKAGYNDHVIGLALVRLNGENGVPMFKAATFGLRKAMVRAVGPLQTELKAFEKDKAGREWKARGEAHAKALAAAKWPQFAVRAKLWSKLEPSKKPGGDDYNLGMSALEPTPLEDVAALNRYAGLAPESYGGENKKHSDFAAALRVFGLRRAEVIDAITAPAE